MTSRDAYAARRASGALVATVLLGCVLAGCGGDPEPAGQPPAQPVSADVQDCREKWQDLAREVDEALAPETEGEAPTPSDLRSRWVTVTAQVGYYATSGRAGDCEATLEREQDTIDALADFSDELAPLDVEKLASGYERDLTSYSRPSGRAGRGAPSAAAVETALADLQRLAPEATADQAAGWQQAAVTDLADEDARDQAVADLRVLSGESRAYRQAERATQVLERALAATAEPDSASPSDEPSASPSASPGDGPTDGTGD